MWFAFPENVESIGIEGFEFQAEITDPETKIRYFRAPEMYAGKILDCSGFRCINPPAGLNPPADLPSQLQIGEEDRNINALVGKVNNLELENSMLKSRLVELLAQRDELKLELATVKTELKNAQFDLEKANISVAEKAK